MSRERLRMPATMESYDELRRFVLERVPKTVHQKVDLVLEELLLNVIYYAYTGWGQQQECPDNCELPPQKSTGEGESPAEPVLEVELHHTVSADDPGVANEFIVRIRDWGRPFDPVQRARPDTSCSIEKRTLGGLGILLVRKMADSVSYRREADQNILDVRFITRESRS
ncbi:MAG: ATP-binding protein [Oceanidesulfovibrio sp.]